MTCCCNKFYLWEAHYLPHILIVCIWLLRCYTLSSQYIHQSVDYSLTTHSIVGRYDMNVAACSTQRFNSRLDALLRRALIIEPWDSASNSVDTALAFTSSSPWFNIFPGSSQLKHDTKSWYFVNTMNILLGKQFHKLFHPGCDRN